MNTYDDNGIQIHDDKYKENTHKILINTGSST